MILLNNRALVLSICATLCNGLEWNGPSPTITLEHPGSTAAAHAPKAPKPTVLRRATSALSVCGFESGQARRYLYPLKDLPMLNFVQNPQFGAMRAILVIFLLFQRVQGLV